MNYLKMNKEFLKCYRNDLYEQVKAYEKNNRFAKNIEWDENVSEIKVKQGKKNIYLHSIYDKEREINKVLQGKPKQVEQLCVFGLPSIEQFTIIGKYFTRVKRIFVIMPSVGILYKWLQNFSLAEFIVNTTQYVQQDEFVLVVGDEFKEVKTLINNIVAVGQHEKIVVLPFVSYLTLFPEFFLQVCKSTRIALADKSIMGVTRKFWRNTWLIHNWSILKEQTINLFKLRELFANNTCIVVAAGASLEKNIHLLPEAKNKAIIIAAGTAINVLAEKGIEPHFHIAVDGSDLANKIFKKAKNKNVPLICSYSFYSPLVKEYQGDIFAFAIGAMDKIAIDMKQFIKEEILVSSGGLSVVNIAHAIAVQMGCKKIVIVGQDCCFTANKVHASGSWSEGSKYNQGDQSIALVDINGNPVYSSEMFVGINRAIAGFIRTNPQCKFINATEGGLNIEGARNVTLRDVIDKELKHRVEVETFISNIRQSYFQDTAAKEQLVRTYALGYRQDMLTLKSLLEEQKAILNDISSLDEDAVNYLKVTKAIEMLNKIEKNEFFTKMMRENFVFDINEVLLLDLGTYKYELSEGLKLVNKRFLEHVNAAVLLSSEFLGEGKTINRVVHVREQ